MVHKACESFCNLKDKYKQDIDAFLNAHLGDAEPQETNKIKVTAFSTSSTAGKDV